MAARRGRGGVRRVRREEGEVMEPVAWVEEAPRRGFHGGSELSCGVHGSGVQERTRVARERGRASEGEWRSSSIWFE